jgi:hypothetical protein
LRGGLSGRRFCTATRHSIFWYNQALAAICEFLSKVARRKFCTQGNRIIGF